MTCLPEKELLIYHFVRKLYREGASLFCKLSDEAYYPLLKAVRHMHREVELLRGFIRFSEIHGILFSEITPKNRVLPLLRTHFSERYCNENFMIYDRSHHEILIHSKEHSQILPLDTLEIHAPDASEVHYQLLWKCFYHTISITERNNPKLRMSRMPKRYWENMTEFQETSLPNSPLQKQGATSAVPGVPGGTPALATHEEYGKSAPVSSP